MRLFWCLGFVIPVMIGACANAQANSGGRAFRDCATCPQMVSIAPGSFTMGVPPSEEAREHVPEKFQGQSVPQHRVSIGVRLAIGKFDVTRGEFAAFVRDTGYQTGDQCQVYARDADDDKWTFQQRSGFSWRTPGFAQTDRHPAVCISWDDAVAYATWLSRKTGHVYRLPSEAEWEYAARAGSQTARYWGDDREQACLNANVSDQTLASETKYLKDSEHLFQCSDGYAYTSPVGALRPNAFGLFDMLGNVWQWVQDCVNENYQGAPTDGSVWAAGNCERRGARGGSWYTDPRGARAGFRYSDVPAARWSNYGFRLVRTQ
jgi:sulfatase modifying factor 1